MRRNLAITDLQGPRLRSPSYSLSFFSKMNEAGFAMNSSPSEITSRTLSLERYRAVMMGIFESAPNIFILLIIVRWFQGTPADKSLVAAAVHGGLLIAPLVLFVQRRLEISAPRCMFLLLAAAAVMMALAGVASGKRLFTVSAALSIMLQSASVPLLTGIYATNVPATLRGRYFSQCSTIRMAASIVFATAAGWAISGRLEMYPGLIAGYVVVLGLAAWLVQRIPTGAPSAAQSDRSMLACFSLLKSDQILRQTTIAWNLLGFGNLMMVPLRVEYLANSHYGLHLSEIDVALLVSTIPNVARVLSTGMWGRAFDAMNFFSLRMVLNLSFVLGTLSFFATGSWLLLVFSAALLGFTTAGGEVAWNLWVTKFAPAEKVPDYMAVHTFFTGVRGIAAPCVGFFLLQYASIQTLSWISAVLMFSSVLVLARTQKIGQEQVY